MEVEAERVESTMGQRGEKQMCFGLGLLLFAFVCTSKLTRTSHDRD